MRRRITALCGVLILALGVWAAFPKTLLAETEEAAPLTGVTILSLIHIYVKYKD